MGLQPIASPPGPACRKLVPLDGVEPPTTAFVAQCSQSLDRGENWSEQGDSNSSSSAWKAEALPLGDVRSRFNCQRAMATVAEVESAARGFGDRSNTTVSRPENLGRATGIEPAENKGHNLAPRHLASLNTRRLEPATRTRTCDLRATRAALYHLSYAGKLLEASGGLEPPTS